MLGTFSSDGERVRGGKLLTRVAVVTESHILDGRPDVFSEEAHIGDITSVVLGHQRPQTATKQRERDN